MRTEALVYAAVAFAVACVVLLDRARQGRRFPLSRALGAVIAWGGGIVGVLAANQLLERAVLGGGLRASRAASTADAAGADATLRVKEALTTTVGMNLLTTPKDWVFGAVAVVLVMYGAWRLTSADAAARRLGAYALAAAGVLYGLRLVDGLGFVPGVLTASPLAAAGLAVGWSARRWRPLGAVAMLALPVVWLFQYSGGANPQWGGRYVLVSSTLLVVGAGVVLAATPGRGRVALVTFAAVVTLSGVAWLAQRSHTVADAMRELRTAPDVVLVSREAHVLREGGAFLTPDTRWLTATGRGELSRAAAIAEAVDAPALEVVQVPGRRLPVRLGAYTRAGVRKVEFLPGLDLQVVRYSPPPTT
jgi:hypothetical protein